MKNDYLNLVEFWNNSFAISEEDKKELTKEINQEDYKQLAPSPKLYEVLTLFKDKKNVLDYGCGSGWASIIMVKSGTQKIDAVDVANNSIIMLNEYKKAFQVIDQINGVFIDEKWLSKQKDATYDGFYCSNVIDVIPLEMAKEIIKESARVTNKDALTVFSLNYYINPEVMKERGCQVDGINIYIDGVLRLSALTDEEWTNIFKEYYQDIELSYFAWPGEQKETRRIFYLEK